jgi:hypothetical protein
MMGDLRLTPIVIEVDGRALPAELNDSPTARALMQTLPLEAEASVWGEEIYFATPVEMGEAADAVEEVPVGTLAYWPPGRAFCIFFGPTPVSRGAMPRAYSPVNVIGQVGGDPSVLRRVRNGAPIRVRLEAER